jgi:hypothetical protein
MTVGQMFAAEKITKDHLTLIREESDYWNKSGIFMLEQWEIEFQYLSPAQAKWVQKILDDMTEMRIEKRSVFE